MSDDKSKEFLYTLLGGALLLKDRFSDQFDEILKKAQDSKDEIKENISEGVTKANEQKDHIEDELKKRIKSIVDELGLATKDDIDDLKKLIKKESLNS